MSKRTLISIIISAIVLILAFSIGLLIRYSSAEPLTQTAETFAREQTQTPPAAELSHMISRAEEEVLLQDELTAGCETYACTMLFRLLGFDVDEFTFADDYLISRPVDFDERSDDLEGPDMYSAFAGDVYDYGFGAYASAMAKSMNRYLTDQKSELAAYAYENISLETLCEEYIDNDIPVMIWATVYMDEPYVGVSWVVDYVDENAKSEIGDTVEWYGNEHCLLLVGYDEKNYYFGDSSEGIIMKYEKSLAAERYRQLGSQSVVVK